MSNLFFLSLDDILSMLYMKVKQHERIEIRVNRQDLLLDGIRQLQRKKSLLGLLRVQFFGESGIDTGGLRKEFLSGKISGSRSGSEMWVSKTLGRVPPPYNLLINCMDTFIK